MSGQGGRPAPSAREQPHLASTPREDVEALGSGGGMGESSRMGQPSIDAASAPSGGGRYPPPALTIGTPGQYATPSGIDAQLEHVVTDASPHPHNSSGRGLRQDLGQVRRERASLNGQPRSQAGSDVWNGDVQGLPTTRDPRAASPSAFVTEAESAPRCIIMTMHGATGPKTVGAST